VQGALTDNAAALQQRVTVANNPFLATLAAPGEAQFLTAQKPCSILLPHNHQKANEFYSILFGTSSLTLRRNAHSHEGAADRHLLYVSEI
jgi:hypothetical protein